MLLEFTVGNYRSFRDKVTLSMLATHLAAKSPEMDERNVFEAPDGRRVLRAAVIYGANASGKSNLSRAVLAFVDIVRNSASGTTRTPIWVEPFLLAEESARQPSHFETVVIYQGVQYRYGFEATEERVEREWLYQRPGKREVKLFTRARDQIQYTSAFSEGERLAEKTRPNSLFLSVCAQFNGRIATAVSEAMSFHIYAIHGVADDLLRAVTIRHLEDQGPAAQLTRELLQKSDLGVVDFSVHPVPSRAGEGRADGEPRVFARHRRISAAGREPTYVDLSLADHESDGTQKLFVLAGWITDALQEGRTLVVDELDARMHPLLARAIVELFLDPKKNPKNAQLIFATHDPGFLDPDLFRRDQIWFTEKDEDGASHLYSLAEYKGVRADEAWRERYLAGRYGGTPILRRFGETNGG